MNVSEIIETIKKQIENEKLGTVDSYCLTSYYKRFIDLCKKSNCIVIVGAGKHGQRLFELLKQENMEDHIACFADNNSSEAAWRTNNSYEIVSVEDAARKHRDSLFVISTVQYANELMHQLGCYGVPINRIIVFSLFLSGLVDY